jgi:hypothetical protein
MVPGGGERERDRERGLSQGLRSEGVRVYALETQFPDARVTHIGIPYTISQYTRDLATKHGACDEESAVHDETRLLRLLRSSRSPYWVPALP